LRPYTEAFFGTTKWVCDPNDTSEGCQSQYSTGLTFDGTYAFGVDPVWQGLTRRPLLVVVCRHTSRDRIPIKS
jgi:hypothetical protein